MLGLLGVYMVWVVNGSGGVGGYRGVAWLYTWRVGTWGGVYSVGVDTYFLGVGLTCGGGWGMYTLRKTSGLVSPYRKVPI